MGALQEGLQAAAAAAGAGIQGAAEAGSGTLQGLQAQHQAFCAAAEQARHSAQQVSPSAHAGGTE
jgi:hypothetical protein